MQWLWTICAVLAIFAVIFIGAVARRVNWLNEEADRSLLKIVVNILMPALILKATLGNPQLLLARNILLPPVIGFFSVLIGCLLALITARLLGRAAGMDNPRQWRTFALCVGLYNYGYVPIPLVGQVFGGPAQEGTLAVLFVHNLGVEIAMWTVGVLLVSGHLGRDWYRRIFNAPSVTIAVALVLNLLYAQFAGLVPDLARRLYSDWVFQSINMLAVSAIPVALLLIGATVADVFEEFQFTRGLRIISLASILRLGILPVLFLLLAWVLPGSAELKRVVILQAAMPSAVFPIVLSRHYGGDPPTAVRVVLGTSLLSLATMPFWLWVGLKMLAA